MDSYEYILGRYYEPMPLSCPREIFLFCGISESLTQDLKTESEGSTELFALLSETWL